MVYLSDGYPARCDHVSLAILTNMACSFLFSLAVALVATLSCALPAQHFNPVKGYNSTGPRQGIYGMDASTLLDVGDFQCLKNEGIDFAIIRAYQSADHVDPNAKENIANAWKAGITYVDVYMFPCTLSTETHRCGSPSSQVKAMVDALRDSKYGNIWLDIEDTNYWFSNTSQNQAIFEELLTTAKSYRSTGVYTKMGDWNTIMGSGYTGGASAPLWYAHWDDLPSFNDFIPFGGWTKPAIKQYFGDITDCGVNVDKDWSS